MASKGTLDMAARILCQLGAAQSQGSLVSQAHDCADVVQALGYYDLADHLRRMAGRSGASSSVEADGIPTEGDARG